ncbi:MAG: hypothetical protein NXY59_03185 [Aigarchaeota archaeon]|nr:hypothetical protein [Candidatus Pelearchaeum maunauluense]
MLTAVRYGYDPRANEYRYIERTARIISNILRNPSLLRKSDLRLVAVVSKSVLSKNTAETFLEMLDEEGIEYSTYSYVIDEGNVVRRLIDVGLDHKDATLLIDLVKAFPIIIDRLRRSDRASPERIRDSLRQELGEEYDFMADIYSEALRLGRRLTIKEAKRRANMNKAFSLDILKSLKIIE